MAQTMGRRRSDLVAAVGCHAMTSTAEPTADYTPTPFITVHGTTDATVGYRRPPTQPCSDFCDGNAEVNTCYTSTCAAEGITATCLGFENKNVSSCAECYFNSECGICGDDGNDDARQGTGAMSVPTNAQQWRVLNECTGCDSNTFEGYVNESWTTGYKRRDFFDCANGANVSLITLPGVGHFPYNNIGVGQTDVDTTRIVWEFVSQFSYAQTPAPTPSQAMTISPAAAMLWTLPLLLWSRWH